MDWLHGIAGLFVGIMVGMTGVGGGSLMAPILILLFGVAPATAVGTDLWFAAITKSVGGAIHHRHGGPDGGPDYQVVKRLCLGSLPAALITLLMPGAGPPPTRIANRFVTPQCYCQPANLESLPLRSRAARPGDLENRVS